MPLEIEREKKRSIFRFIMNKIQCSIFGHKLKFNKQKNSNHLFSKQYSKKTNENLLGMLYFL